MNLKVGDKVRVRPYNEAIKMYNRGELDDLPRYLGTNEDVIYGILWEDYYKISKDTGIIAEVYPNDYSIDFYNGPSFYIPAMLIETGSNIYLPNNLFEL